MFYGEASFNLAAGPREPREGESRSGLDSRAGVEVCCGTEAGSYLRLIDSCITQRKAQGLSRTCNERKEEEEQAGVEDVFGELLAGRIFVCECRCNLDRLDEPASDFLGTNRYKPEEVYM